MNKKTKYKYQRIIDEWFVNGFNGAEAYRKFHKHIKKDAVATAAFSRIQAYEEIQEYITEKHEEAAKFIDVTKEGILLELKNWIESDITDTFNLTADELKELPVSIRRLITKYKHNVKSYYNHDGDLTHTEETVDLWFVSKERAIDMINKHIGFYEADNKQKAVQINYDRLDEKTLLSIWDARKKED